MKKLPFRNYWLLKSEPSTYSYEDLERDHETLWDGVRNYQAKNNLLAMAVGDWALFYHSMTDKAVVGVCQVSQTAMPDPTDTTAKWVAVKVIPVCRVTSQVTLADIKQHPRLCEISLVKQGRLSVMPVTEKDFLEILALSQTPVSLLSQFQKKSV